MTTIESAWLDYAYKMMTDVRLACSCEPYTEGGIRWPGYIGSNYKRVLFVGARHNAKGLQQAGLGGGGPLASYATELRSWVRNPRSAAADCRLLQAMQSAYQHSYPIWAKPGSVWGVFAKIKVSLGMTWDEVASVNLARCYAPATKTGEDDEHIRTHAKLWSLDRIVKELKPRIVFVSKDNEGIRNELPVTGENLQDPLVVRYSNHGMGKRNGESADQWVPRDTPGWLALLKLMHTRPCEMNGDLSPGLSTHGLSP